MFAGSLVGTRHPPRLAPPADCPLIFAEHKGKFRQAEIGHNAIMPKVGRLSTICMEAKQNTITSQQSARHLINAPSLSAATGIPVPTLWRYSRLGIIPSLRITRKCVRFELDKVITALEARAA
jgi:hypothetical protein